MGLLTPTPSVERSRNGQISRRKPMNLLGKSIEDHVDWNRLTVRIHMSMPFVLDQDAAQGSASVVSDCVCNMAEIHSKSTINAMNLCICTLFVCFILISMV